MVTFRALQGVGGAIMFPAALAIVVATFDLRSRGRALALFFGIAGGLTAIGPIAGGYLIEWTWRAIFWINIPVAMIALVLIAISKPDRTQARPRDGLPRPGPHRRRASALSVLRVPAVGPVGLGQPGHRAEHRRRRCAAGRFFLVELRTESPLIRCASSRTGRSWSRTLMLGISMLAFIPVFFFASDVRADLARRKARRGQPAICCTSSSASWSPRRSAAGCWTGSAPSGRWCSAARWPPSASASGPGR